MRRTLLMIAAVALLLTQCRKPAVELPTAGPANENMVSMTVTVGHGRTLIGADGAITWSENDKLYVGDGSKYIGCLELQSGEGSATGTFSGSVSTTSSTTFGFYYLGSNPPEVSNGATSATVSFASQTGLIGDLDDCHIGYGTATGKVEGTSVVLDTNPVQMTSKVAMAYFDFKDGENPYKGAITLSGANICNSMTVGFNGSFSGTTGTAGNAISLASTPSSDKYVMLVPPATVGEETLEFGGGAEGSTKFYKGIEANKFYCLGAGEPIVVSVTPKPIEFTVGMDGDTPRKVKFAPGNLWADATGATPVFHFEANQWDFHVKELDDYGDGKWDQSHVSHFKWSDAEHAATDDSNYNDELFCASNFTVAGDSHTWRTLSKDEWDYLLNSRANAEDLWDWVTLSDVGVSGLVLLPDGSTATASGITTSEDLASHGAVFLPAAGRRGSSIVTDVGSRGFYWSSTPCEYYAYDVEFKSGEAIINQFDRYIGYPIRLVW